MRFFVYRFILERPGNERLDKLRKIVEAFKSENYPVSIPLITANDFSRYCEICYNANDYLNKSEQGLLPLEKYHVRP